MNRSVLAWHDCGSAEQEIRLRTPPPPSRAASRPRASPDDKAAAVLAGARSVFLAPGFSAATTDMIQRAADVSKATVYARYPT